MTGRMRVVQLLTQDVGGPVDHAVDVAVALAGRGLDSQVVGPVCAGTQRARSAGVEWHELSMTSKTDLTGGVALSRRLAALRPDVLHLQDRRAGWLGRALGPALPRTGIVYTLHGVADGLSDLVQGNARAAARRRRDRLYYLTGERAINRWGRARVVVPSAAVARFAVDHVRLDPAIVDVVPNGVDPVRFRPQESGDRPPTVLWLGVLAEVKRVELLLDAAELVPELHLRIAGDGPLLGLVQRRSSAAALAGRVSLLGRVADPAPVFAEADFFALTSAAENCPLAMLQAMACGLPVVSTAVGGIPEVVRDGVEGTLCRADDVSGFVEALGAMTTDRPRRQEMGRAARERILGGFTIDHCVDGLLESYERARSAAPGRRPIAGKPA